MKLRLILTERCNWKCTYCDCRGKRHINLTHFREDIDIINKYHEYDTVTFSGGEPGILSKYEMEEVFYIFRDKKIHVFTNGKMFDHNIPDNVEKIFVHCAVAGQIATPESLKDITKHRLVVNSEIIHIPQNVDKLLLMPAIRRREPVGSCVMTTIRYELLNRGDKWRNSPDKYITAPLIHPKRQRTCILRNEMIFNAPRRLIKECHGKAARCNGFPPEHLKFENLDRDMYERSFCKTCWYPFEVSKDEYKEKTGNNANDMHCHLMHVMSYKDAVVTMKKEMETI